MNKIKMVNFDVSQYFINILKFFYYILYFKKTEIVTVSNLQTLRVGSIVKYEAYTIFYELVSIINTNSTILIIACIFLIIALIFMRLFYFIENSIKFIYVNFIYKIKILHIKESSITDSSSNKSDLNSSGLDKGPSKPDDPKNEGFLAAITMAIVNNRSLILGSLALAGVIGGSIYYIVTYNSELIPDIFKSLTLLTKDAVETTDINSTSNITDTVISTASTDTYSISSSTITISRFVVEQVPIISNANILYDGIDLQKVSLNDLKSNLLTVSEMLRILREYTKGEQSEVIFILRAIRNGVIKPSPDYIETLRPEIIKAIRELLLAIQDKKK